VTFAGALPTIHRFGLRPASDLLQEAGREREANTFRAEITRVPVGEGESVLLRNQRFTRKKPLDSLDGISEAEWWRLVNNRVFFFVKEMAAIELAEAYENQGFPQQVLELPTGSIRDVAHAIEVTTCNSGVFPRVAGRTRGRETFVPLASFDSALRAKIREVTVVGTVRVPYT
jgi:hypothetical protein